MGAEAVGKGNLPKLQVVFGKLQLVVRKRFWQLSQTTKWENVVCGELSENSGYHTHVGRREYTEAQLRFFI